MMAVDQMCVSLAEYFLEDIVGVTEKDILQLAAEFQTSAEEACSILEDTDPGSETMRNRGCTCRYVGLGGNDPDGHIKTDRNCPLHGIDPDAERDRRMDR